MFHAPPLRTRASAKAKPRKRVNHAGSGSAMLWDGTRRNAHCCHVIPTCLSHLHLPHPLVLNFTTRVFHRREVGPQGMSGETPLARAKRVGRRMAGSKLHTTTPCWEACPSKEGAGSTSSISGGSAWGISGRTTESCLAMPPPHTHMEYVKTRCAQGPLLVQEAAGCIVKLCGATTAVCGKPWAEQFVSADLP